MPAEGFTDLLTTEFCDYDRNYHKRKSSIENNKHDIYTYPKFRMIDAGASGAQSASPEVNDLMPDLMLDLITTGRLS